MVGWFLVYGGLSIAGAVLGVTLVIVCMLLRGTAAFISESTYLDAWMRCRSDARRRWDEKDNWHDSYSPDYLLAVRDNVVVHWAKLYELPYDGSKLLASEEEKAELLAQLAAGLVTACRGNAYPDTDVYVLPTYIFQL